MGSIFFLFCLVSICIARDHIPLEENNLSLYRGRRDRMVVGFKNVQLPVQSVPIATNAVSSNPAVVSSHPIHGKVYRIQHYVIRFVIDLRQGQWFSQGTPVSLTNKTDRHDIAEILLKVALNTICQPINHPFRRKQPYTAYKYSTTNRYESKLKLKKIDLIIQSL